MEASASTIRRLLLQDRIPPAPRRSALTWRGLLVAHAATIVATDFFHEDRLLICDRDQVVAEHPLAERAYERLVIRAHFERLAARRDRRLRQEAEAALAEVTRLPLPVGPEVEKRSLSVYEGLL